MRKFHYILFMLTAAALVPMMGCRIPSDAGIAGGRSVRSSVSLEARFPASAGSPTTARGLIDDPNVKSVSVAAYHDSVLVGSASLVKRQGFWGGVVQVSELGSIQFNAVGMDGEMNPLYQGQATATVTGDADSVTITVEAVPLSPPTGLAVDSVTSAGISLSWAPVSRADGYQLFRDTSLDGAFATLAYSGASPFCTDSGLLSARTYYYKVKASNLIGQDSDLSAAVWDTTMSSGPFQGHNAIAQVAGPAVGTGSNNAGVVKPVTVNNLTPSSFQVPATAYGYNSSGDYIYMALPVTNISGQAREFVKLTGVTFYDSSNNVLTPTGYTLDYYFVTGSVSRISNTCLANGETGYVLIIEGSIYSALDHLQFSIQSMSPGSDPGPIVLAETYTYSSSSLTVSIRNSGTADAVIRGYTIPSYILLDSNEATLTWGYFTSNFGNPTGDLLLPVGGTATGSSYNFFSGRATGGIVFLADFEAASGSAAAPALSAGSAPRDAAGSREQQAEHMTTARNQRIEELKLNLLGEDAR